MPRRSPIQWPNNARIAITPAVAFEIWPDDIGTAPSLNRSHRAPLPGNARFNKDLSVITDRQYGERVGVYRMLDVFASEGVNTTFFINGMTAEVHPDTTREIKAAGHEIATESYIHDYNYMKDREQERIDLEKTVEAVRKATGEAPQGFLSMGIQPTENTPELVAEIGYLYWADLQHDELPYTLRVNGRNLAALSYAFPLNDYTSYSEMSRSPRELFQIWKDTFDWLYEEGERGAPKMMLWGLHPFLTGRPFRAVLLREFIRYAKGHPGVWFARCIDVANWWLERYQDAHVEDWPNCLHMTQPPVSSRFALMG
ncbi:MAG TPA: polysaccharide deacetylase family protein [Dehalococcoidia bacterium]|nr:polysaccharide deacetylase family protein [Dehalococcoidia bacterium]